MRFASPLVLALLALSLCCAAQVDAADKCGFNGVDLSSIMGKDYHWNGPDGSGSGATYDWYMHVCGGIQSQAPCTDDSTKTSSAACQIDTSGWSPVGYMVGKWDASSVQWGKIEKGGDAPNGGITAILAPGQSCSGGAPYTAIHMFICDSSASEPTLTVAPAQSSNINASPPVSNGCAYAYMLRTKAACGGGGSSGGLSGGWVFIIILCVVIPIYIIGGCVYKKQRVGATGMEMCPNIDFWRSLPGLVKDGCKYTWFKLRSLCNKGAQPDGQTYETM